MGSSQPLRPINKARIRLCTSDFQIVFNERWLTDDVVNSFAELVNHRDVQARSLPRRAVQQLPASPQGLLGSTIPRVFMFNTHYFSRLSVRPGFYDYTGVPRWTKKQNLCMDAVDVLLVPVLMDLCCWVLVIINVRDLFFMFYDHYLSADDGGTMSTLRRWMKDEVHEQLGPAAADVWSVETWPRSGASLFPRQQHSSSCAVLALGVADRLAVGCAPVFTQQDIPLLRRRLA